MKQRVYFSPFKYNKTIHILTFVQAITYPKTQQKQRCFDQEPKHVYHNTDKYTFFYEIQIANFHLKLSISSNVVLHTRIISGTSYSTVTIHKIFMSSLFLCRGRVTEIFRHNNSNTCSTIS